MASDDNIEGSPETEFSFGVRELRSANLARKPEPPQVPRKQASEKRGFDPYNTSGSFGRKNHWARGAKR